MKRQAREAREAAEAPPAAVEEPAVVEQAGAAEAPRVAPAHGLDAEQTARLQPVIDELSALFAQRGP